MVTTLPKFTGNEPCRTTDPEVFYHEPIQGLILQAAKGICFQHCDIRQACAEYGIAAETYGVWGGLSPSERRNIRKSRGIVLDQHIEAA